MMTENKRLLLLGVPFDTIDGLSLSERIAGAVAARQKLWISTANLDWLVEAKRNPAFLRQLEMSDIITCDGAPVRILSKIAGHTLPHRITGVEIFERLRAGEAGSLRIGFFGGEGDEAVRASEALGSADTPLIGAGGYNPGHGSVEALSADEHIDALNALDADMLVLALGAVKAQTWIERNIERLNAPVISHLGAVVRHTSGDTNPAPKWAAKSGTEWLFRAWNEPALRSRYAKNFAALPGLTISALAQRWSKA